MFKKIISAIDGSFHSELASRHAVAIASSMSSQIIVLAVDTGKGETESLANAIEHIRQYAEIYGVEIKGIIKKGEVITTIISVINEEKADLLVIATRRDYHRIFVHSVGQKLLFLNPCNILTIKPAGLARREKRLLLPLSKIEYATDELIMLTSSLAKFYSHKVEVFHVIELTHWYDLHQLKIDIIRRRGEEKMTPVADKLKALGVDVELRVVLAENDVNAIPKEVAVGKHAMVLMGASRRNIFKKVVYGNPIERMLSSILCDVLIWRQK
jgi:nucleotide-binding universal stress UspA family protein